jgi:hypothetical protein
MRKSFSVALLLFLTLTLSAQKTKEVPAFGKVEKADLELKECSIDKDAEAMYLFDQGTVYYRKGPNTLFQMHEARRIRIKILKEKGFNHANIKLPYYSDGSYEKIIDLEAIVYNLDEAGNIVNTKLEKKAFYRQKLNAYYSAVTFTFPEIKEGSIIEYRYEKVREQWSNIDPWVFQHDIPTKFSSFNITLPEYFQFTTTQQISFPVENKKDLVSQTIHLPDGNVTFIATEHSYKMRDLPSLKEEPFMGAPRDYLQKIEFQLSSIVVPGSLTQNFRNTWPALTKELMTHPSFGMQLKKNLERDAELTAIMALTSKTEKLLSIYRYVQRHIQWDGTEDIYTDGVKNAWSKRKGTTADINLILVNLLKDAKIDAYPLLVSTREHGKVLETYPFLQQFNKVIAIAIIDETPFILNAADKYNPARLIPYDVMGTEAYVVDNEKSGFVTLWDSRQTKKNYVSFQSAINEKGEMAGQATISSFDYSKNPRVKNFKESKEKYISQYFTSAHPSVNIKDLEIKNIDDDTLPLEQKVKFSIPVSSSGDYNFFTLNMFSELENNPFVSDTRQTDVDYGYNQNYIIVGDVDIPQGYEFEQPPKNITMIMPDTSIIFRRLNQVKNSKISFRITLEFRRPVYAADEYPALKDFYKRVFTLLNEQIVFRKKA